MQLSYLNKNTYYILVLICVVLFFNSFFFFRDPNIYWWHFYIIIPPILTLIWISNSGKNLGKVKEPFIYIFYFACFGIVSMTLNMVNIVDALYIILVRTTPLLYLATVYTLFLKLKKKERVYIIRTLRKILTVAIPIILCYGVYQLVILGYTIDELGSFVGDAHAFSFIIIYGSLLLLVFYDIRALSIIILILSVVISIFADYKIGLLGLLLSLIVLYGLRNLKNLVKISVVIISVILIVKLSISFGYFSLPPQLNLITKVINVDNILSLSLNEVYPADFELFKGYIQLFTEVLNSWYDWIIGVGPGNYATNIALLKEKYYATEYVIKYRNILDADGVIQGSLLSRDGVLINIIAEFGLVGAIFYGYTLFKVVSIPIQETNNKGTLAYTLYLIITMALIIEAPFFPILNEGIHFAMWSIFGMLVLIERKKYILVKTK